MAQMQRNNKKFVEMASKANSSMLASQQAHQQMLLNQFTNKTKPLDENRRIETFENIGGSLTATNSSQNNRSSSQQMTHAGSRSSKNAIMHQNLAQLNNSSQGQGTSKHNSSSSKRKASKKLG